MKTWYIGLQEHSVSPLLAAVILVIISAQVRGNEMTTTVAMSAEHSNNSELLTDSFARSEMILIPSVGIDYKLDFTDFTANLRYSGVVTDYQKNTFDDRREVLGEGQANWSLLDNKLNWEFAQNISRLSINSNDPDTPQNETTRNFFQTGPSLQFNLGSGGSIQSGIKYVTSRFDDGAVSNATQHVYSLNYGQRLSGQKRIGLGVSLANVEFSGLAPGYENQRISLTYSGGSQRIGYSISLGPNKIERDIGSSTSGTFVSAQLSLSGQQSNSKILISRQLTDSGSGLAQSELDAPDGNRGDGNVGTTDVVERSRLELNHQREVLPGKVNLNISLSFDEQDYDLLPSDQESTSASVAFVYRLSPRVSSSLSRTWTEREFMAPLPTDIDKTIERGLRWEVNYTPNSSLRVVAWTNRRTRSAPFDRGYSALLGGIRLEYRL